MYINQYNFFTTLYQYIETKLNGRNIDDICHEEYYSIKYSYYNPPSSSKGDRIIMPMVNIISKIMIGNFYVIY